MKNNVMRVVLGMLLCIAGDLFAATVEITQNDNVINKLNAAQSGDTVRFYPGTYEVNINLVNKNLILEGVDTKNTILKAKNNSNAIIEINGASIVRNFTFLEANTGIKIYQFTAGFKVVNNVFRLGESNTALNVESDVTGDIHNNTFYDNSINLVNESNFIIVKNNIFTNYSTFVSGIPPDLIAFNCFDTNVGLDSSNIIITKVEDIFVNTDAEVNDFHLKKDVQCIDQGEGNEDFDDSQTDIGAYGGVNFDKIPDSVSITSVIKNDTDPSTIEVQWAKSEDYRVEGYKLYYSDAPVYTSAKNAFLTLDDRAVLSPSPIIIESLDVTSTTVSDLNAQFDAPLAPVLTSVTPGNHKLLLNWTAVEGATSYVVYYVTSGETERELAVENVTQHTLTELSNDKVYTVWVKAVRQSSYYFQVATYIGDPRDSEFAESYFVKEDRKVDIGDPRTSDLSNKIDRQPEAIVAYPVLPNEGCFIATAAFGYYSATQVQTLRGFRDKYLLSTSIGTDFVDWYYHYGPYAANVISEYPQFKPIVRGMLYPLIVAAEIIEISVVGFFLYVGFLFMLLLLLMNSVIGHFKERVSNS